MGCDGCIFYDEMDNICMLGMEDECDPDYPQMVMEE